MACNRQIRKTAQGKPTQARRWSQQNADATNRATRNNDSNITGTTKLNEHVSENSNTGDKSHVKRSLLTPGTHMTDGA
jgi:hypothetical protein